MSIYFQKKHNEVGKLCAILRRFWLQKAWLEMIYLFTLTVSTYTEIGNIMHFPKNLVSFPFFTQSVVIRNSDLPGDLTKCGKEGLICGPIFMADQQLSLLPAKTKIC